MIVNGVHKLITSPTAIVSHNITVPLPSNPVYAAVDTGTTLVGGPASMIAQLYQTIPGSEPGTGDYDGYYTYRTYSSF